jgi:hypothetical protein
MKAIVYLFMLMMCLYGVPKEEWNAMTDEQQDATLDMLLDETMQELGCDEAEATVDIEGKWAFIYVECDDSQYMACLQGGSI